MKKLLFLLIAVAAVSISAQAQKKDKKAEKATQDAEAVVENERMLQSFNFQFNPSDVEVKTGGRHRIIGYEYMRFYPNSLQIRTVKFDPTKRANNLGTTAEGGPANDGTGAPDPGSRDRRSITDPIMEFSVETVTFDIIKNEPGKKDNSWVIELKTQTDAILTFLINVDTRSGQASIKVSSNKEEPWTYRGKIVPN